MRSGFTLTDVLVSLGVMATLIGLMLPAMGSVRSAAEQVVCGSNLRQIGMGLVLYADGNRDQLPPSIMAGSVDLLDILPPNHSTSIHVTPANSTALRLDVGLESGAWWDGLGVLYSSGYLPSQELFYCPSHRGPHTHGDMARAWRSDRDLVVGNYQYRGGSASGVTKFSLVQPSRTALVADTFRSQIELNHDNGFSLLRADLSTGWLSDTGGQLLAHVPDALDPLTDANLSDMSSTEGVEAAFYDDYWAKLQSWPSARSESKPGGGDPLGSGAR